MIIDFANVPIYGICILVAFFFNGLLIFRLGKIQNINNNTLLCSLSFEFLGMIIGAKLLNMLQRDGINSFYYAGFSSYGGVIGAIISLVAFSKLYNIELKKLLNIYIPLLPLLYSISKLGCFFNGCCYGIEYNGFGSIIYKFAIDAPLNISLFPIQFIESIFNLGIFIFIILIYKKNKDNLKIIEYTFVLCGLSKFVLEFFRASWNGLISSTQSISLIFIFLGILINLYRRKNEKL